MINVIIPPIIILLIIALLITIFARAVKNMNDYAYLAKRRKKAVAIPHRRFGRFKKVVHDTFVHFSQWVKGLAYRRNKKAILHVGQAADHAPQYDEVHERSLRQTHVHTPSPRTDSPPGRKNMDPSSQHKLSRMGELILSYHRGGVDGAVASNEQDTKEAYYVQQIEANPKNPDTYQQLGDYYMEMNKFEDARESYKYVLRIDPRHKRAQEAMKNLDRVLG